MGRTLLGVDLDESRVGDLVKRLLTDEELEKLADGGRPADDERDAEPTDHGGEGPDQSDQASDDTGSDSDGSDGGEGVPSDEEAVEAGDTGAETGYAGTGYATGSVGDRDWRATETDDESWQPDEDDGLLARFGEYQPLVLKGGAVVLLLVVIGLLVWRYGGRVKGALPVGADGDGSGERDAAAVEPGGAEADGSPARRLAKVGGRDEAEDLSSEDERTDSGAEGTHAGTGPPPVGEDVDLGALLGLGTLALIAALVRKFGEQRSRDPLVDGPEDEA